MMSDCNKNEEIIEKWKKSERLSLKQVLLSACSKYESRYRWNLMKSFAE